MHCLFLLAEYPKSGRCSVEIIKELDNMIIDLIKLFARSCGNRLPNKIVFYRDGVDDGQYQKVLDNEVAQIKHAFRGSHSAIHAHSSSLSFFPTPSSVRRSSSTEADIYRCEETTQHAILRLRWSANEQRGIGHGGRSANHSPVAVRFLPVLASRTVKHTDT